jgi:hypothetical protein
MLEVLAAVSVLAIVYLVLASAAIEGLRAEGESLRRLEASLIADELLSDIEAQLNLALAMPESSEEIERDEFLVRIDVRQFDPELDAGGERPDGTGVEAEDLAAFLELEMGIGFSILRTVEIEVSWTEGAGERSVLRRTFGYDAVAAAEILGAAAGQGSTSASELDGGTVQ